MNPSPPVTRTCCLLPLACILLRILSLQPSLYAEHSSGRQGGSAVRSQQYIMKCNLFGPPIAVRSLSQGQQASMDRKAAAERRRAKVLARGGDRLASITGALAEPSQSTGEFQAAMAAMRHLATKKQPSRTKCACNPRIQHNGIQGMMRRKRAPRRHLPPSRRRRSPPSPPPPHRPRPEQQPSTRNKRAAGAALRRPSHLCRRCSSSS